MKTVLGIGNRNSVFQKAVIQLTQSNPIRTSGIRASRFCSFDNVHGIDVPEEKSLIRRYIYADGRQGRLEDGVAALTKCDLSVSALNEVGVS